MWTAEKAQSLFGTTYVVKVSSSGIDVQSLVQVDENLSFGVARRVGASRTIFYWLRHYSDLADVAYEPMRSSMSTLTDEKGLLHT